MKNLITILLLLVTVSSYAQINTIKVGGIDTAAMLDPYKRAYPRQAVTLAFTTTGTSGASTMSYNNITGVLTVNIPQYTSTNYWTASGNDIYNNNSANVGIGTSSPAQKLDVNGQFKVGLANVSQIYPRSDAGQLSIFGSSTPVKGAYILLNSANPSGFSDSGSALINYGDYTTTAPTNSLLRFRYVNNGRAWDNLSVNANGYAGVNTNSAHNPLSVEPRKYTTGQASQSGATVTGVGTTWTSDMVGDYFKWPSQTFPADRITAVNSTTSITLALEQPVGNATVSDYEILRVGLQVTPLGRVGIGTASPTQAFHVTGQARIDSLLTGTGSDSIVVVNNGTLKKVLQSSVTGTGTVTSISSPNSTLSIASPTTTPTADINLGHANFFTTNQSATIFGVGTGSTTPSSVLHVVETSTSTPRGILADQYNTGTQGSRITMRKARGTFASPTVITTGDVLGSWTTAGHDGTGFIDAAKILVTSTGTIGTNTVPAFMDLQTMNAAGTLTTGLSISSAQAITLPALNATGIVHNSSAGLLSTSLLSLTADVSGVLPIANGGYGAATTSQNFAFIGPTSGSGAPSFRALVAADIPSLSYRTTTGSTGDIASFSASNTTSNISAVATGSIFASAGTGALPVWTANPSIDGSITFGTSVNSNTRGIMYNVDNTSNQFGVRFSPATGTAVAASISLIPKGTGYSSTYKTANGIFNTDYLADPTNYELMAITASGSIGYVIGSYKGGTGTARPIILDAGVNVTDHTNPAGAKQLYLGTNGNIGIGTTTPTTFELDVQGAVTTAIRAYNSSTPGLGSGGNVYVNSPLTTAADQRMGAFLFGDINGTSSTNAAMMAAYSSQAHTIGSSLGSYLDFFTVPNNSTTLTRALRIDQNQNVGIGDASPASLLTVGNGDLFQVNSSGAIVATTGITSTGSILATQFKLSALNTAPSSAADTGTLGEIRIVNGFIYVCVATNTWQRSALTTF